MEMTIRRGAADGSANSDSTDGSEEANTARTLTPSPNRALSALCSAVAWARVQALCGEPGRLASRLRKAPSVHINQRSGAGRCITSAECASVR